MFFSLWFSVSEVKCSLCNSIIVPEGKLSWAVYTAGKTRSVLTLFGCLFETCIGANILWKPSFGKKKIGVDMWFKKKKKDNNNWKKNISKSILSTYLAINESTAQMVSLESRTLDMFHSDKTGELIWKLLCQLAVCL